MKNPDNTVAIANAMLIIGIGAAPLFSANASVCDLVAGAIMAGGAVFCAAEIYQQDKRQARRDRP